MAYWNPNTQRYEESDPTQAPWPNTSGSIPTPNRQQQTPSKSTGETYEEKLKRWEQEWKDLQEQRNSQYDFGSFVLPQYSGAEAPSFFFEDAPTLSLPQFNMPTLEDALKEPGYEFRSEEGRKALERSAAARGVLRTGGTLKDLIEYGQNFAMQEYGNVFNRALTNYQTENQRLQQEFAPRMREWEFLAGAEQARGLAQFSREFDLYQSQLNAALAREQLMANAAMY